MGVGGVDVEVAVDLLEEIELVSDLVKKEQVRVVVE